ncbi:hypothetical protein [Maritalea sp.]|jgi:hypothetical protein|uniref:hypothetical protein n=1 Tax=Maritalea sp. TaxID=2003361 RepID=UPI0039E5941D
MINYRYLTSKAITAGFILYWMVFWLFNGLDKFLNRSSIGGLTWFGKDRNWQFGVYLENLGISLDHVPAILTFAGLWELVLSVLFLSALNVMLVAGEREQDASDRLYVLALFISALTFIGFSAFDTVVGDRAELLEHSTYMVVIAVSYICMAVENMVKRQRDTGLPAVFAQTAPATKLKLNPVHTARQQDHRAVQTPAE